MVHRIFVGGRVFTAGLSSSREWGVSVRDGRIDAVGTWEEVADLATSDTEVEQLDGGLLLPGFQDAHMHPVGAGMEILQCDLSGAGSSEEALRTVAEYAASHPDEPWILGGGWSMDHFPGGTPRAEDLDRVTGGRPALLANRDHHGSWFNTAAARAAGIDRTTADPADGRFERDADGTPNGTAHEGAVTLFDRVLPARTLDLQERGLLRAQEEALALGITGWQDALVGVGLGMPDFLDAYCAVQSSGRLTVRAALDFWWDRHGDLGQLDGIRERRERVRGLGDPGRLSAPNVKVMVDGVAENYTALLSDAYLDTHGHPTGNHGIPFVPTETLATIVPAIDAAGFGVHFHALGDAAVTASLDAIERAQETNGISGNAHQLAHLQFVARHDIPRFARLGAIANLQALWAHRDEQFVTLTEPFVSPELLRQTYPFGQLSRAGAPLAGGSDWPVSSADPLAAAYVATHRLGIDDGDTRVLTSASERLDLAEFLAAYTAGSAVACGRGGFTGRIAEGYAADFVVLEHDPFAGEVPVHQAAPLSTWIDGEAVWRRDS